MAWSASGVFREFIIDPVFAGTTTSATGYGANGIGASGDGVKVSLHNNTITPDKDAVVGSTGFNTGVWTTTNEVTDVTNWVSGGRSLAGQALSTITGGIKWDGTDLAGGGTLTLTATHGCFVYDDTITAGTVADQGICFNYFGGAQQVTNGTFTIVWHANGIFTIS